jgi:phytoene dehydrogenase-like protein
MKRVAIIGAGLGGLATGIRLAHAGFDVTIL